MLKALAEEGIGEHCRRKRVSLPGSGKLFSLSLCMFVGMSRRGHLERAQP